MYLMPVSRNILTGASLVPSTHRYEPAFQPDNLLDFANPGKPCLGLGAIRTTYVHIDFKEGGAFLLATLKTTAMENPAAVCAEAALKMTAAGAHVYHWHWRQDGAARSRYRFVCTDETGNCTLHPNTGPNEATSALKYVMGFRNQDRSFAATHQGDLAISHNPVGVGDAVIWDMSSAKAATVAVIVRPYSSRGLRASVDMGITNSVGNFHHNFGDHDTEIMFTEFSSAQSYRFAQVSFTDPHREDVLAPLGTGAGCFYLGPHTEIDDFAWSTYVDGREINTTHAFGTAGAPFLSEYAVGQKIHFEFTAQPGLSPKDAATLYSMFRGMGTHDRLIVAMDPANEPNRETALCEVVSPPTMPRHRVQSKAGRRTLAVDLAKVRVT